MIMKRKELIFYEIINFSEKSNQKEKENFNHDSCLEEIEDNESLMDEIAKNNGKENERSSN